MKDDPSKVHQPQESSHWVWRMARDEIRTKDAWVVGGEDDVKKMVQRKEAREEKVEKLNEEIKELLEKLTTKAGKELQHYQQRLVKKKNKLKKQQGELKRSKGQPVGLKKFLEEVVLPHCELCPP